MKDKIGIGTLFHEAQQNGFRFPPKSTYSDTTPLDDIGNAERFVTDHRDIVRWYPSAKTWLCWDGHRWKPDPGEKALALAMETARGIFNEAAESQDKEERAKISKWANTSAAANKLDAMLRLAKPSLAVTPDKLDQDQFKLNCLNGTIDLRTGKLNPHSPDDLITKLAPVKYRPKKQASRFASFLNEIFGGNQGLILFIQRALGYCLTGSVSEQKLFFCHGAGQNGKSTLFNLIREILGDYAQEAEPSLLIAKRNVGGATEDVARLKGIRLATTFETNEYMKMDEARVKQLTGGDRLAGRYLYGHITEFDPTHKLFVITNHLPQIDGQSTAIWRRIMLLPFTVKVPDNMKDKELSEKLRSEVEGVLAWLVRGCLDWQTEGLTEPREVEDATAEYRAESDSLEKFLQDCCSIEPSRKVQAAVLREEYHRWCTANGEPQLPAGAFSKRMKEKGYKSKQTNKYNMWCGLSLTEDEM